MTCCRCWSHLLLPCGPRPWPSHCPSHCRFDSVYTHTHIHTYTHTHIHTYTHTHIHTYTQDQRLHRGQSERRQDITQPLRPPQGSVTDPPPGPGSIQLVPSLVPEALIESVVEGMRADVGGLGSSQGSSQGSSLGSSLGNSLGSSLGSSQDYSHY